MKKENENGLKKTLKSLCKARGIEFMNNHYFIFNCKNPQYLYRKIEKGNFNLIDLHKIIKVLNLSDEEILKIVKSDIDFEMLEQGDDFESLVKSDKEDE